jgi:hypothetical protein
MSEGPNVMSQEPVGGRSEAWASIVAFYEDLAGATGWSDQSFMVEFSRWAAAQPWSRELYPNTSHQWLCVKQGSGYHPDEPFVSAAVRADGQFECEHWSKVGVLRRSRVCPIEKAPEVFESFILLLRGEV